MRRFVHLALVASVMLASSGVAIAADDTLMQAKRLLESGNAQGAYSLLIPLQSNRAGDPEYDFLLGSAALQLGKNTEAVFALERVLAVQPNSAPARALIARAYFNLNETRTARREFENVRKQDVPDDVRTTIDRFLDAIQRVEEAQQSTIRGYIEVGLGYDGNVNSATSNGQIAVPLFGGAIFTLAQSSTEQADGFAQFGGGFTIQAPVSKRFSVFGGLAYSNKSNFNESDFSTSYYDGSFGASLKFDRDTFTLAAQANVFHVNDAQTYNRAYREAVGGVVQWQHDFDARNQLSAFAQASELRYPEQEPRNANRYVGGIGFAHAFTPGPVIYLGAYGGTETEKDDAFPQLGHDLYGVRFGGQQSVNETLSIFLNASAEWRNYGGPDPFFLVDRDDEQYGASAGIHIVPKKNLRITPQVSWTRNQSNIEINEFDRLVASIVLRQDM